MTPLDLLLGFFGILLFIFPGWYAARSRGLELPCLAGFIFGAVGLVLVIQLLEAVDLGLSARTVFWAWLAVSLIAVLTGRRSTFASLQSDPFGKADRLLLLPIIPAIAVVAYRAIAQPLSGIDTIFRWNFLAEQMMTRGTLAFYPPVSAVDYSIYAWPDGIAPVVSSLYFWVYILAHATRPVLTAPFIIFQFFLLLIATYTLARKMASPRAATIACALVACSPIVLWSTAMGQESGLIAIALLAVLIYLPVSRETADTPATVMAGLAAALGGLAREYGLVFILFGLALGLFRRLSLRTLGLFLLIAGAGTLPWYGRNWLHTGNPFFNLDVAGLFPVNTSHLRLMQIYQRSFGWGQLPSEAPRIFVTNCMAALLGGAAGVAFCFSQVRTLLMALIVMVGLWATSLGYTAAGFTYSLRVLTPALAIAAVLGGMAIANWVPKQKYRLGLSLALLAFASDAGLRALVLPATIYKIPPSEWLAVGSAVQEYHARPVYRELADYASGQRILVLGPTALLNHCGARVVPLWSPEVTFVWDASLTSEEATRRLADTGIGFVLLNKGDVNREYLSQIALFRNNPAASLQRVWEDSDMTLLKVNRSK